MEERQQLQRRLNEQLLDRAEADPEWRRRFIEDPETTMDDDISEAQRLQAMLESTMPIDQPREATSAQEDYRELNRRLT
jgi:type II secretory pathway component PulF